MATAFNQLAQFLVTDAATTHYTATNKSAIIQRATAFNASAGAVTVDCWLFATGGTAGDSNKIFEGKSIAANATISLSELEGHVIPRNAVLQMQSGTSGVVTVTLSGLEVYL